MVKRSSLTSSLQSSILTIVLVWVAGITVLLCLQMTGAGEGMSVIPIGEDRVWTQLLTNNSGFGAHRQWWAITSRNPLAPWWYWGFSPLILGLPEGLYIVRKVVDLFLAISVFLLVNQIGRGNSPRFALACGVLVLLWNFTGYVEQILLVMLIALGFSVLSVFFYCRYLASHRSIPEYLALSLLLFLVALTTYSIQSGVPLAVFLLAVLGRPNATEAIRPAGERIRRAIYDTALYAVVFVLFTQIWITTSGATSTFFKLDMSLIGKNFWQSVTNLLWHADTSALVKSAFEHWTGWSIPIAFAGAVAFFYWLLGRATERTQAKTTDQRCNVETAWLSLAVALALVAPTIALESTSTIWYPGSRSTMVQQVFQPVVYVAVIFLILTALDKHLGKRLRAAEMGAVTLLCAFATVVGLEYNRQLVEQTTLERNLEAGLKAILPAIVQPTHLIVRLHDTFWYSGRNSGMTNLYVQTIYKSSAATLDAVYAGSPSELSPQVTFADDNKGVFSPASGTWVPYSQVKVLEFDGKTVLAMSSVDAKTFSGFQARFARDRPFLQAHRVDSVEPSCPTSLDFDAIPVGTGWSTPERSASGDSFVWMANTKATINLTTSCRGPLELKFRTLSPMAPDILESLRVSINGTSVPLKSRREPNGATEFAGTLSAAQKGAGDALLVEFFVSRTVVPAGGERTLAIPFHWLRLAEKSKSL